MHLLAKGHTPATIAAVLGCSLASSYTWAAAWRQAGVSGLQEAQHGGRSRCLDATAEQYGEPLLASDPQAHGYQAPGWTVPLLHRAVTQAGYAASARTVRRTVRRLGWTWKRPASVRGRPDPDDEAKQGR